MPALQRELKAEIIGVGRKDFDLLKQGQAEAMLEKIKPDAVIHLAARVGGIIANKKYPADFFYDNILIEHADVPGVLQGRREEVSDADRRMFVPGEVAVADPRGAHVGRLPAARGARPTRSPRRSMLVQSESYRRQYGFNSVVLIPGNVYGEYDNFNEEYSHVIPALIRRFLEAKEKGAPSIACFGSGRPTRDFVYAGDVAAVIPWFLLNYNSSEPVNISSGTRITIKELSETIREVDGLPGRRSRGTRPNPTGRWTRSSPLPVCINWVFPARPRSERVCN